MKTFTSMGIDNEPFKATGSYSEHVDLITIDFDHSFSAMKFGSFMKQERILGWVGFYGDSNFSRKGPFLVRSVKGSTVTLIKA